MANAPIIIMACGAAFLAMFTSALAHEGPVAMASDGDAIVVDGHLSDWPEATRWTLLPHILGTTGADDSDLSGAFAVAVDRPEGVAYIALRVRDDVIVREPQGQNIDHLRDNPDGALVYLDLGHRAGAAESIELSWVREPILVHGQSLSPQDWFDAARRESQGDVVYEWRVDLAALAQVAGVDIDWSADLQRVIGFNIEYWDRDGPTDGAVLRWMDGARDGEDASLLGDLIIGMPPSETHVVSGRTQWLEDRAGDAPRWAHFELASNPNVVVHAKAGADGVFEARLPEERWRAFASDPLTLQSVGERIEIDLAAAPTREVLTLTTDRPRQIPLRDIISGRMTELGVRTVGVAYIQNNEFVFNETVGLEMDGSAAGVDTVFRLASITKPISATAFLSLVEDGRLRLDTRLADAFIDPDLRGDPRVRALTFEMAMRHLTGLPNWRGSDGLEFIHAPGTVQEYSGEGYEYARRAIEAMTGEDLQPLSERTVFEPAGMTRTSHRWPEWAASSFAGEYFGYGGRVDHATPDEPNAAANLLSTPTDLGRFAIWINETRGGISAPLWEEVLVANSEALRTGWSTSPHAVGWIVHEADGVRLLEHSGGQWGIRTHLITVPERGDALVVLTNSSAGWDLIELVFHQTLNAGGEYDAIRDALYE